MKWVRRLVSANHWYDVSMLATIDSTLKKHGISATEDLAAIRRSYKAFRVANKHRIADVQSEYHVSWSSMILAMYLFLKGRSYETAAAIEKTSAVIFENMGADSVARYISKALDKSKDAFSRIVASSKSQEKNFFGKTFGFYRPVDNKDRYHLRVGSCLYNDFFRQNGAPELMAIACKWDIISWTKGIDAARHKVIFSRPKTLGLDGKDCEFNFERVTGQGKP